MREEEVEEREEDLEVREEEVEEREEEVQGEEDILLEEFSAEWYPAELHGCSEVQLVELVEEEELGEEEEELEEEEVLVDRAYRSSRLGPTKDRKTSLNTPVCEGKSSL